MKLTKIKLINWHLFSNMTIEVNGNFLITGENGSGKSTLVDAMYYLLSGGDAKRFNSAANNNSKRTLVNYIKGRTGNEGDEFIRGSQDIISHIAMEFFDEKAKNTRLLGVVLELPQENQSSPKVSFYTCYATKIVEDYFIQEGVISTYNKLRNCYKESGKELKKLDDSIIRRKQFIARDVLRLEDATKYADLLRNAIAFKPIDEVSSFVNDFLLKNDDINIDSLITEIRQYQELQNQIARNEKKIKLLESFIHDAEIYRDNEQSIQYLDILLSKARISENNKAIENAKKTVARLTDCSGVLDKEIKELDEKIYGYYAEQKNIRGSESYKVLRDKEESLKNINNEIEVLARKIRDTNNALNNEKSVIAKTGLNIRFKDDIDSGNFILLKEHIRTLDTVASRKRRELQGDWAKKEIEEKELREIVKTKAEELGNLKKGKSTYDDSVTNLRDILAKSIEEQFGRKPEIRPLCELMNVTDDRWSNAIEGFLGFHRFDLVIDKKYYDFAVKKYEEIKNDFNIFNVGIAKIEPKAIGHYKTDGNTLFSKVEPLNKAAESAAFNLLGNVYCEDGVDSLKNHECAVLDSVMVFKDGTAFNVSREQYKYPFIGEKSMLRRVEILTSEIEEKSTRLKKVGQEIYKLSEDISVLNGSRAHTLVDIEDYWSIKARKEKDAALIEESIEALRKEKGMLAFEDLLKRIDDILAELTKEKETKNKENIDSLSKIRSLEADIEKLQYSNDQESHVLNQKLGSLQNEYLYKNYEMQYLQSHTLSSQEIYSDRIAKVNGNNRLQSSILPGMNEYSSNYNAMLVPKLEETQSYVDEYHRIVNYEMVNYKIQAQQAIDNCNTSFKENFLNRMRQKIEAARKQIREMNKALEKNPFGNDQEVYEFIAQPSKDDEMKEYYRIIMGGKDYYQRDLFTEGLTGKDKDTIDNLLKALVSQQDTPEGERKVKRYLDYRNYMVYDIKFTNKYNETQYFSKTNTEKSGGETQTPFYVVIASCFDRLFKKDLSAKESSACLVIYDEAFNNMDEGRISALMDYYKKLNIQLAVVVPSNRMSALGGYMDTSIGLLRQGRTIREYTLSKHE